MLVPRTIAALASHTDGESTRYALGGVRLERDAKGEPHALATDGRRLIHVTWSEAPASAEPRDQFPDVGLSPETVKGFETILPTAAFVAACKSAKPRRSGGTPFQSVAPLQSILVEESTANGAVKIGATDGERVAIETLRSVEGRFPRWRDVFPKETGAVKIRLDAQFLIDACQAVLAIAGPTAEGARGVDLTIRDAQSAVVVRSTSKNGPNVEVVIMPLAVDR